MTNLFRTLAAGSAIAFALAACSTDMDKRWNSDGTSGATMSSGTTGSSSTSDRYYNGQPTPYGAGEAGATPTPASGSTTTGTTRGQ